MSIKNEKMYDVIRLKDGREGAIVDISRNGDKMAYAIDFGGVTDVEYVTPDQVEKVIWAATSPTEKQEH
jgi:hypothetical protein